MFFDAAQGTLDEINVTQLSPMRLLTAHSTIFSSRNSRLLKMSEHNFEALKEAYQNDEVFQLVCEHFANKQINQYTTKVDTLFKHVKKECLNNDVKRLNVISALKVFEAAGCGRYIKSRYGSRFEWYTKTKELCEQVIEGESEDWEFISSDQEDLDDESQELEKNPTVIHTFYLREDFVIELELPADLTANEAYRLSSFTGTLSFEE